MDHCDNCVIRETLNGSRNSARIPTNQSTPRVRTINRKEEKKKQRRFFSVEIRVKDMYGKQQTINDLTLTFSLMPLKK